ncbi:helix-turn-helix domain-containing protein [Sphingomonas sp. CCH10-B3]|nr:AraC family transcriptional regulator [Sphingomonas sp. CCH10-B3]
MDLPANVRDHHAVTGGSPYDSIRFSAIPNAELLSRTGDRLQAVRQISVGTSGTAHVVGSVATVDTLLVNLNASRRHRGHIGNIAIDRPLQRGQVSFVPNHCPIDLEFPWEHSVLALFIPKADMARVAADLGVGELQPIASERHDRLRQLIQMCITELRSPGFASDLMIEGLVRAVGATLLRQNSSPSTGAEDRIYLSPVRLARVIEFIDSRLDQPIHLNDLAEVAGLSPFHFSRMFKLATGETPYHFVGSRRLDRARTMLVGGDLGLAELALACGFASQSHFTAAFTKAIGTPPGRYRRQRGR